MNLVYCFIIALLTTPLLLAQNTKDFTGLNLHTGISYQSSLTKVPQVSSSLFRYNTEDNIKGIGIDLGLSYQFKKVPISLTYFTRLRYDYKYTLSYQSFSEFIEEDQYGFIFDQHFQLKYHVHSKKNHYFGLAYSFHNPYGKFLYMSSNYYSPGFILKTNFNAIGILFGQNIYKNLFLEEKIGVVNRFQNISNLGAFYFSLSIKYNFPFKLKLTSN